MFVDHKARWNRRLGSPSYGFEIFMLEEYGYNTRKARRITGSFATLSSGDNISVFHTIK
jgi:hypothetical protein